MIELSKEIKIVVEGKAKHPAFSAREDIKANLQVSMQKNSQYDTCELAHK